jgi:hypothetical protein
VFAFHHAQPALDLVEPVGFDSHSNPHTTACGMDSRCAVAALGVTGNPRPAKVTEAGDGAMASRRTAPIAPDIG